MARRTVPRFAVVVVVYVLRGGQVGYYLVFISVTQKGCIRLSTVPREYGSSHALSCLYIPPLGLSSLV
jgi:hypothetical protein